LRTYRSKAKSSFTQVQIWYSLVIWNPVMETEFYGDGQHNDGVYYWGNLNPYIYTYQNPIKYIDPNGKQGIPGALLGAFTEYASIVGEKMLFEDMSFSQANSSLSLKDGGNMAIAAGVGAASGILKFTKWAGSSSGRKILVKLLESGIDASEDVLKQYVKEGEIDLKQTLISTLTSAGMSKILNGTSLEKHIDKQGEIINNAENKISAISASNSGSVNGRSKKIRKQEAIISRAAEEKKFYEAIKKTVHKTATSGANTVTSGAYNKKK